MQFLNKKARKVVALKAVASRKANERRRSKIALKAVAKRRANEALAMALAHDLFDIGAIKAA